MTPTALGVYLLVLPDSLDLGTWQVAQFDRAGRYTGGTVKLASKAAAHKRRRELVRHHKRVAAARKRTG